MQGGIARPEQSHVGKHHRSDVGGDAIPAVVVLCEPTPGVPSLGRIHHFIVMLCVIVIRRTGLRDWACRFIRLAIGELLPLGLHPSLRAS